MVVRFAARGPARFDPLHQQYDTLDLSSLVRPGTNLIAAEVMYWGQGEPSRGGPIFQMSARPAFVLESTEVKSDRSWKTLISAGQQAPPWECVFKGVGYFAGNWLEQVDARKVPVDWEQPGFNDASWPNARAITRAGGWARAAIARAWSLKGDQRILYAATDAYTEACPAPPDMSQGYVWRIDPDYELFVADPDGGQRVRLTENRAYDAEATVSPKGDRIVYEQAETRGQVFLLDGGAAGPASR